MFLFEAFLEIEEIKCFDINNDVCAPLVKEMVPYFEMVQEARRPLLGLGSFKPDEMRLLLDSLEPRGLFPIIMVNTSQAMPAGARRSRSYPP
jgi:hypothetical protein